MITFQEALKAVREKNLSKQQLEHYHQELSYLKSELVLELADLKKEKALFLANRQPTESIASKTADFNATQVGLRKITVEAYISSTTTMLSSLKSRLYELY